MDTIENLQKFLLESLDAIMAQYHLSIQLKTTVIHKFTHKNKWVAVFIKS